ncbi:hypothetical protein DPMN_103867 [Dreissena polymorpha]|uniref:Uncharacterized protein n=1 Tax=Dreissena polymorpha TaxID=45954 RepID=A0A9D4H9A3_DREPO|nr:hypothetical protein DPMN_103867 [Dreissena polymorpha]
MSAFTVWRNAGINYIRYSSINARAVRDCLKADLKADASKRGEETIIKAIRFENGKPIGPDGKPLPLKF